MSKQTFLASCPADCDTDNLLPAIPENQGCTSYDLLFSQISDLYIRPSGAPDPLTSWSSTPTATSGAIDNTVTDNSKCKWVVVEGSVKGTSTISDYPKRKRKVTDRIFRAELIVRDMANHYDFLTKLQCGSTDFTFYLGDLADYVYGKAGGVSPEFIDVDIPQNGGKDDKQFATIILEWTADGNYQRRVNPL